MSRSTRVSLTKQWQVAKALFELLPKAVVELKAHFSSKGEADFTEIAMRALEALIDADGLFLITEWPEFKFPKYKIMKKLMSGRVIFDGRNVYDTKDMKEEGFDYFGIGIGMSF